VARYIVVSDIQFPYHDAKALRVVIDYIANGGPWDGVQMDITTCWQTSSMQPMAVMSC
jgi:hypothetical protein